MFLPVVQVQLLPLVHLGLETPHTQIFWFLLVLHLLEAKLGNSQALKACPRHVVLLAVVELSLLVLLKGLEVQLGVRHQRHPLKAKEDHLRY